MDKVKAKIRRDSVRNEIIKTAKSFIDEETKTIDVKGFYKEHPYYKNKIGYYFGSAENFYQEIEALPEYTYINKLNKIYERRRVRSVRDELAVERLQQLRSEGLNLRQIGEKYGVSRQLVHELVTVLDIKFV